MRRGLTLAALLLPLAGCYVPPGGEYGYAQPGYEQPGYGQPAYGQPAYDDQSDVYPGYSYNDGSPTIIVEGAPMPLIFFGGAWGYHDRYRQFHRAPDPVWRQLERQHPRGYGERPYEGPRSGGAPSFGRPEFRQPAAGAPPRMEQRPPTNWGGFASPAARAAAPAAPPPARVEQRPPTNWGGFATPAARAVAPAAPPPPAPAAEVPRGGGDRHCPQGQLRC